MGTLTFYFDFCFGKRLPESIEKANPPFGVEWHQKQRLKQNTTDDAWLALAGSQGWIVFSHDRKFHGLASELKAIKQHQVGCFYLWGANAPTWEKLCCFVRGFDGILELANKTPRPFIFHVQRNARIKQVTIP